MEPRCIEFPLSELEARDAALSIELLTRRLQDAAEESSREGKTVVLSSPNGDVLATVKGCEARILVPVSTRALEATDAPEIEPSDELQSERDARPRP